jgi:hypothetical protein
MKWVTAKSNTGYESYELFENNKKLLRITLNPEVGTARIETDHDKRLFFLRKEGFFKNRCVLRNEYGVKIGKLSYENAHPEAGFVEMENEILNYSIEKEGSQPQLVIFKDHKETPLVTCSLLPNRTPSPIGLIRSGMNNLFSTLLMTLCWYEFSPVAREQALELSA